MRIRITNQLATCDSLTIQPHDNCTTTRETKLHILKKVNETNKDHMMMEVARLLNAIKGTKLGIYEQELDINVPNDTEKLSRT